jgi:hypothetical protein
MVCLLCVAYVKYKFKDDYYKWRSAKNARVLLENCSPLSACIERTTKMSQSSSGGSKSEIPTNELIASCYMGTMFGLRDNFDYVRF